MAIILYLLLSVLVCGTSAVSIMPELKQNVLRFGYGVNFRYEGMLMHSFDRFYVVTKVEIPRVLDLNLTMFQFDYNCSHVANIGRIVIGLDLKLQIRYETCSKHTVRILFHTCIYINIRWNIIRRQYIIFWKKI